MVCIVVLYGDIRTVSSITHRLSQRAHIFSLFQEFYCDLEFRLSHFKARYAFKFEDIGNYSHCGGTNHAFDWHISLFLREEQVKDEQHIVITKVGSCCYGQTSFI